MANASILTQITPTNGTNLVTIYQPEPDHSGYITTLKATVNIKSIIASNFPYIPDSTPPESIEAILVELSEALQSKEISLKLRKGTGNWIEKNRIRLFNKEPYYEIDLMAYMTDANTIDVAEDLQIGLQMIDPLEGDIDSIVVFGFAVEEKKTNDVELLAAKVEALELALYGRLTDLPANSLIGSVSGGIANAIPFGDLPFENEITAGNTSQYWRGDKNWQVLDKNAVGLSNVSNLAQVDLVNNQNIGGNKSFIGFTTLGDATVKMKEITGTTNVSQSGFSSVVHELTGAKIISLTAIVRDSPNGGIPNNYTFGPGFQFDVSYDSTRVYISNIPGNSANILNKPFSIFIVYKN